MKKVFAIITGCVLIGLVACGPSAADKEKMQRMQDSITQDSLMKIANANATTPVPDDTTHADTTKHN